MERGINRLVMMVKVAACQDERAPEHYCSDRPAWTALRTDPIPEYDTIDPSTVRVFELNSTQGNGSKSSKKSKVKPNDRKIYWSPPRNPNGHILAYHAWLIKEGSVSGGGY